MKRYNLRVYAIIINQRNEILLSSEHRHGQSFTKFPGGGIHWGEGTADALNRELVEELGCDFNVGEIFYVNDFFQVSAFNNEDQLISFYYHALPSDENNLAKLHLKKGANGDGEMFHWKSLNELKEADLTFPIDKIVAKRLISRMI